MDGGLERLGAYAAGEVADVVVAVPVLVGTTHMCIAWSMCECEGVRTARMPSLSLPFYRTPPLPPPTATNATQTHILHSTASSCEQNGHLKTVETTCFLRVWIFLVDFFRLPMLLLLLLLWLLS